MSDVLCAGDTDFGVFYGGDGRQLSIQILGTVCVALWTSGVNSAVFAILKYSNKLRVPPAYELDRLNASHHGNQPDQPIQEPSRLEDNGIGGETVVHATAPGEASD